MGSDSDHTTQPAARVVRAGEVPFWRLAGVGAATVTFGLAVLAWPHVTLRLLEMVTGVWVLAGLAWLLGGFAAIFQGVFAEGGTRARRLGLGAASIVIGVAFLTWPGPALRALVLAIGLGVVAFGVTEIAVAVRARRSVPTE